VTRERVLRVGALTLRYLLLISRDPSRVLDVLFWPFVDVAVWAFLTLYVNQAGAEVPNAIAVFVGAAILWNVFLRAAQDVAVSFLDDVWARSVVTLFVSPLTIVEFALATMLVGAVKALLALGAMALVALVLYAFDLFDLGWALVPFAANLVCAGWSLGLVALAIIVRFGGRWMIIAYSLPFLVMPFSAVFWPEAVLPPALQAIARAIPLTHVFEGMRAVVLGGTLPPARLAAATAENVLFLALAAALVAVTFRGALERGALPKLR
jgi:ABC-2 type transport system permease protein